MPATRRDFLKTTIGSSALLSLTTSVPQFLLNASAQAATVTPRNQNILVVIQLSGGNDGLNTVVPYGDDAYQANRFTLRIAPSQVLKVDDHTGLHPALKGFARLLEAGKLAIVQGVGYPNPDRSHFSSMDIWQSAQQDASTRSTGWIGRYLDRTKAAHTGLPALHFGSGRQPLALVGRDVQAPTISSLADFKLDDAGNRRLRDVVRQTSESSHDELLHFLRQTALSAIASSERVQEALRNYRTSVTYPSSRLAQNLRTVAQLIEADLTTRIYYLSLDGFDTHANQGAAHTGLLTEFSAAIAAFIEDLTQHEHDRRVMVMTFSEFGRRVKENASRGTDHGTAAPMFLAGGAVRSGLIGKHPSLTDLEDGDLKFHTDFRQVYASVLEQWLQIDSQAVLGASFQPAPILKTT